VEARGLSGSWMTLDDVLRSSTPARRVASANLLARSLLPSATTIASASQRILISELNHAARRLAVYASQNGSPRPTQHSLPADMALSSPDGTSTRWVTAPNFKSSILSFRSKLSLTHVG
jgi:hypothetical protein